MSRNTQQIEEEEFKEDRILRQTQIATSNLEQPGRIKPNWLPIWFNSTCMAVLQLM